MLALGWLSLSAMKSRQVGIPAQSSWFGFAASVNVDTNLVSHAGATASD
jgi:hypothetical protein